jgi:hypothetical protein
MQLFFFCQCLFDILLPPHCQIYYFNIRKKVNDLLSVQKYVILISVKGKVKIAKIILLRQKISIKRCYFQFKKDRPDLKDPATMYSREQ